MEGIVATDSNPICAPFAALSGDPAALTQSPGADAKFRNTGLERGAALVKDIAWMKEQARLACCCTAPLARNCADAACARPQGAVAPPQAAGAGAKYAA
jgi:hypothetical protein